VLVGNAATLSLVSTSVTGNGADGAFLNAGATLFLLSSSITGNAGYGIQASLQGTVVLNGATITGNAADGITIQGGTAMRMSRSSVTGNQGHQVRIGDLSFARFGPASTVAGSTFPDVLCDGVSAATRGVGGVTATTTNCPPELAPAP
jgi:Right handed beta helix region